ncbi:hypothetical protein TPHA_0B04710 [Tetrapisispora phaffii CBS 4417]|uniref:Uncharacterized protein n=1 Tax=Tetrapisispora phaffii (strain ATCC 24235 / CBS 4417 / NBRC 1672 / NRRL Y-8282 / UCD 70-5) TaxID=1071381 RepID=G8BQ59_TETPH|nr:hypothetical protein TPHA_0B04710 [Tetrapisispora phaffii CBS 4417]CCE62140.1 hypothetical protein TPHA_0B04710 [Tetrapisispora phaffii CBS 4417]
MNQSINAAKTISEALTKHELLQDVIKDSFTPKGFLLVEYPTKKISVTLGNTIAVEDSQEEPHFQFISSSNVAPGSSDGIASFDYNEDSDLFTLVMTDPDAPSRTDKKWSEYCHFVKTDIQLKKSAGSASAGGFTTSHFENKGNVLHSYIGPGPPKGTGLHRYIFLLYKQPHGVKGSSFSSIPDRPNWGTGIPATGAHQWVTANKLELIASNFFLAENV